MEILTLKVGSFLFSTTITTKKTVWFIDYNDYVCFRVTKFGRKNLREILEFVDKVEDKYELYLEFKNPIFMRYGMTKVKYPENKEDEKK